MKKKLSYLLLLLGISISLYSQTLNRDVDPSVDITILEVGTTTMKINFEPNETCEYYYFVASPVGQMEMFSEMMGVSIDELVTMWGIKKTEACIHEYSDFAAGTEYEIYARPYGADDTPFPLNMTTASTETGGGEGVSQIAIELSDITSNSVVLKTTPNAETSVYYNGLAELSYIEEQGLDAVMEIIIGYNHALYDVDIWEWIDLKENTQYKAMARGKNANGDWGEIAVADFATLPSAIDEVSAKKDFRIYPNPSDGNFTLISKLDKKLSGKLIDSSGKHLQNIEIGTGDNVFSFSHLSRGLYWLIIIDDNRTITTAPILIVK